MADSEKTPTLSEQYHLEKEEKLNTTTKPAVEDSATEAVVESTTETVVGEPTTETVVGEPATEAVKETVAAKVEDSSATPESSESADAASGESSETPDATSGESTEAGESAPAATEESSESNEQDNVGEQEAEETPEIKLETAPADFRFPTTNQSRHCFTRYIEYHRCVAAKGEGAPECDKFAKYYRSLCPGEWVDRWNEQRENGTFPGPL